MPHAGRDALNDHLDRWVRVEIRVFGRSLPAFQVCGTVGLVLGIVLTQGIAALRGLSPWVLAATALAAVLTFLGVALVTLIVTGREKLVYYRHEVAVVVVVTLLLRFLGEPVLPYLEVTLLGVGAFLIAGRIGCLMVGCCHGRPHGLGVRYGEAHARAGFSPQLVHVRLFPVQGVESLLVLGVVVWGSALVLGGRPAGEALGLYAACYGVGRFALELARGDADRYELLGFSEAQWSSLILMGLLAAAEAAGALPLSRWHIVAVAGIAVVMAAMTARRRFGRRRWLFDAKHVEELAAAVAALSSVSTGAETRVAQTPSGIRISAGTIGGARHVSLSCAGAPMNATEAGRIAELIRRLMRHTGQGRLVAGNGGVYHWIAADEVD
jgi:hypothetical protein